MSRYTHVNAPTLFLEVGGVRYAHRRFGSDTGVPLIFLQHFRGGMDNWDPLLTDGLGRDRPVILFDNAGVGASTGEAPETFEETAEHVAHFVHAMGLPQVDVLGFSIGGFVAQALALSHPRLVRRMILAGTGPRGGVPGTDDRVGPAATRDVPIIDDFLLLFFSPSVKSQAAGRAFWERRHQRTADVDPLSPPKTMHAQLAALADWSMPKGELFADIKNITQPTLVVNGNDDIMVPTINSFHLAQSIPNAHLIVYPDSGHGAQYQYPDLFLLHAREFLDGSHDNPTVAEPYLASPKATAPTPSAAVAAVAAVAAWPPAN